MGRYQKINVKLMEGVFFPTKFLYTTADTKNKRSFCYLTPGQLDFNNLLLDVNANNSKLNCFQQKVEKLT